MKKTITVSATILTLLVSTATQAQPASAGRGMVPEQRVERITEGLALSPEQQAEIRALLVARQAQRKAERAAVREQIDAVLTEEQRAERDVRNNRRIERRAARIADRLDLTPEQEATLRTVMAEKRSNPDWTPSEMREQLSGVFTDAQLAQLDEMRSHRGRHSRGGCKQ